MRLRFSTAIVLFFSGLLVISGPARSDAAQLDPWKTAKWIWDDRQAAASDQDDSPRFFRNRLTLTQPAKSATLWVTADNRCTTYINGKKLGTHPSWMTLARYDIKNILSKETTRLPSRPPTRVARPVCWRPWSSMTRLNWFPMQRGESRKNFSRAGTKLNLTTTVGARAVELGSSNMAPWNLTQKTRKSRNPQAGLQNQAVDGAKLRMPPGFQAERLYSVPQEQGSWVAITTDPQGRLITSDQYGKLYRVTVGESPVKVEPIDLSIGHAQGLLHAFGSLYVMAHGNKQWPAGPLSFAGSGQRRSIRTHGAIAGNEGRWGTWTSCDRLEPDKKSLYICAGNHTQLPEVQNSRVTQVWQEDQATPRLPDARGHAVWPDGARRLGLPDRSRWQKPGADQFRLPQRI